MNGLLKDDEDRYANVIAQKKEQQLAQAPQSMLQMEEQRYQQVIQQKTTQDEELLRQSLMTSVDKNPDQAAQIQKLAEANKMPVELVQRNLAVMVRDQRVKDLKESARLSPVLSRQLSDPDFAALAFDDTERLSGLERILTKPFDYARATGEAVVGTTAGMGLSGIGELYGVGARKLEGALDQILPNSAMSFLRTPIPWYVNPEQVFKRGGGELKALGDLIGPPQEKRSFDVDVVGAIAQLGSQIAMTLVNPALSSATLIGQGADIMAESVEEDDASQAQKDAAIVAGAGITAITERIGIDRILKILPPKIRNRTLRYIANAAMGGGIEAAQEVSEGLMHDLARRFLTNEDAPILQGAIDEASVAAVAGAIVRAALTKRSYQKAAQQEEFFRSLGEDAKASKLRERMPDKFQQYIENLTKNGPVKEIYIPVDQFNTYFQSKNESPEQKAAQFGATNYMEASAAGTDIVIPLKDFTTKLAPTDDLQGLFPDLRMEQDGLTAREFEQYKAEEEQRMDQILQDAQQVVGEVQTDSLRTIKEEMQQQLIATGYEQSTADAYATVYAKTINTLSQRAGLDAKTMHDQYSLNVTRPLPEVLSRDGRSDIQLDPLLDRLRKGDLPANQEIFGKSLTDFLIEKGGLRPYGELTDVDLGRGPFQRNLVQEMGMDADTAAQSAVEAGYLQGRDYETVTERDLFDAIDEELSGVPQFSVQQTNEQLLQLRDQLENLGRFLQELGVDLTQITDNAEVRRLIEAATQSPEIRDAIEPLFQAAPTAEGFEQWSKGYPVIELDAEHSFQSGEPIVVESIHGTTADITAFDTRRAGIESDLGGGIYSTNSTDDAEVNYAGKGPDLTRKIDTLAERIAADTDREYDDPDVVREATQQFMVNEGVSMPIYVRFDNPVVIGKSGETFLDYTEEYNEQLDEFEEPTGSLIEFIDAFRDIASENRYSDVNIDEAINDLMQTVVDYGGIKASDLIDVLSKSEGLAYATDSQFDEALASKDIIRRTFEAMGFDGFVDQTVARKFDRMEGMDDTTVHFIAFNPEQIASRLGSTWERGEVGADILKQEERGFIQFGKDRKFNIKLLERADLSTFLHETGHFYLEVLGDLAQGPAANPQLQDDYATVLDFLGLKSREELTLDGKDKSSAAYKKAVAAHEKFARANEAYLMEGKAPSIELRQIFQRFKGWLKLIYKDFLRLDVTLTGNIRGVFDRIYATDQEIEAAKSEMSVDPILLDAASAGMTEAEFATYRETVQQASETAKEALQVKIMREMQRERETWWKAELANVKDEVGKEYDELPAAQTFKLLTETDTKLNKAELVERYGNEYLKRLPRGFQRVYTTGEGVPLDMVAKENNFPTGDALVEGLVGLPNRREYINAEAERRMLERHGDMMTDGTMVDQAKIELHNKFREKVLMTELKALRRKAAEVRPFVQAERRQQRETQRELRQAIQIPPASAFRQAAKNMIGQTAVRDIQPNRFLMAERKHGKAAEKALIAGDASAAADAKQKEVLNHFLYLEATKAQEQSDKIAEYVRKFEKKSTRDRVNKAGAIYMEQIDAILDGYEFRRIPNRRIDRRATLQAFVEKIEAQARSEEDFSADPIYIPQSVLDDARQINYRQLSFDELQAVNEAVRNIDNVARLKNKLLKIAEKRELDDVVSQAFDQIRSNTKGGLSRTLESALAGERVKRFGKGFMLIHTKFSTMAQQMDGWKEDGFFWNLLVRPLNDAASFEAVERAKATKKLSEIFKPYRDTSMVTKKFVPSLGVSMTLEGRLSVALNWGRAENRQRLMDGNGFTSQNINDIFATLDSRDWKFVKDVWEMLDSYFPMIEAQYTKLYGVPPQKSEIIPFQTKEGDMLGGYYPINYDPTKSARAMAQSDTDVLEQMKTGAYVRSMTKNGHTKEVLEHLDRAVKLDFSTIYQHLDTVVHDLALREYLIDANKLMNHRFDRTTLKDVIIDSYGDQFYREIVQTLKDVTIGDISAQNAFDQSLGHVRSGVAIMGMGWSLWTGLMQPLGLTQSMVRIGPKWVAKGLAKWGGDIFKLQNTAKMIYEKSPFMQTRYLTQNREINDIRNQIKRQGKFPIARETYGVVEDSYFQLIIQFQKVVDIPTWLGAYEKGLAFGKDEVSAIALADQAVLDSQSGGAIKDLSRIQRGSPLLKIWTVFYSYFNTTFNLMRISYGRTDFRDPVSIGRMAVDVFMTLLAPAAITTVMREAVNLIQGGEPSEEDELIDAYIREQIGYILGTVVGVREFASAIDPRFSYSGPAGVRIIAEAQRLATQISQGELDDALRRSAISVGGILLHYPAAQINRIIDGMLALEDGRTDKPGALIFGAPR